MDDALSLALLCLSAMAAGVVNAVAGGGTLLTFPSLLVALAPLGPAKAAVIANITSTVALLPGSLASAWGYRSELHRVRRLAWLLVGPSLVGGAIGGLLLTRLDPSYFAFLVPWLTLIAATLFLAQPLLARKGTSSPGEERTSVASTMAIIGFQSLVAIYGGYFGAGIGILMLGALAVMGLPDVHQMNALKNVLGFLINVGCIVAFSLSGQSQGLHVRWRYALLMGVAAIIGGYVGARGARHLPRWAVRWFVIFIGFGLSAYFFYRQLTAR